MSMGLLGDRLAVQRNMPMPVNDVTASTNIVPVNNETVNGTTNAFIVGATGSADVGSAAGTAVIWYFDKAPVYNSGGFQVGNNQDTSFSFGTGTVLTTEIAFDYRKYYKYLDDSQANMVAALTTNFTNGQFAINYEEGFGIGLKATTGTTDTYSYKTRASYTSTSAEDTGGGGSASGGGLNTYVAKPSGTNADATSARASATTITVTGLPYTFTEYDIVSVRQVPSTGLATDYTPLTHDFSVSGTTITVAGANFGASDALVVTFQLPPKGHDAAQDANKSAVINQLWTRDLGETKADVTNETNATVNRYLDMAGYDGLTIQFEKTGGTDSVTLTVEATCQDDGTAAASCVYQDITQHGMVIHSAAATAASYTADAMTSLEEGAKYKYVKIKTVSAGGSNDADYALYVRRWKK